MKFCQPHWDKLRKAIADRGLDHLGAKDAQQAQRDIVANLQGEEHPYDPLMDCHWMIMSEALRQGDLYIMGVKEDGSQYCPVCEAIANGYTEAGWIDGPADAALKHCREKKLVAEVQ